MYSVHTMLYTRIWLTANTEDRNSYIAYSVTLVRMSHMLERMIYEGIGRMRDTQHASNEVHGAAVVILHT